MPVSDDAELAALLRAARAYKGVSVRVLATAINQPPGTVRNWLGTSKGEVTRDRSVLNEIAAACGVPPTFFDVGFEPLRTALGPTERELIQMRQQLQATRAQVQRMSERLAPLLEDVPSDASDLTPGDAHELLVRLRALLDQASGERGRGTQR